MFSHLSRFVASVRLRFVAGVACLAIIGAAGVLIASDPLPLVAPASSPSDSAKLNPTAPDTSLARSVLAAIEADPLLKDANIIVSVVDRGVVVGGPVLSEEVKKRAEVVVRGVSGVESVKNTCFVETDPEALMRAVADRLKPDAKSTSSAALPGVALSPVAPEGYLPPLPEQPPSDLIASTKSDKTVVAQRPSLPVGPAATVLGAPVSPFPTNTAPASPNPSIAPGSLTGSVVPIRPGDVRATVMAIRKTDTRFARLEVEVKSDGGLLVTGWSAKASDAWDFAGELRKIPGVLRVAVDPNLVK